MDRTKILAWRKTTKAPGYKEFLSQRVFIENIIVKNVYVFKSNTSSTRRLAYNRGMPLLCMFCGYLKFTIMPLSCTPCGNTFMMTLLINIMPFSCTKCENTRSIVIILSNNTMWIIRTKHSTIWDKWLLTILILK